MTTAELIEKLAAESGLEKAQARKALQALIATITSAAKEGDSIALAGLGQFKVRESPARQGRNPSTGETIEIAAAKKLTFAAAKSVKELLNP
jgi:DNA-binding protein HU-beta